MATTIGTLRAFVGADISGLRRGMADSQRVVGRATANINRDLRGITSTLTSIGKVSALAIGAAGVAFTALATKSVGLASDLEETTAKFETVFGDQIDIARRWADELVDGFAVSTREAQKYLGAMQDLLVPMGLNAQAAAKMSFEVVKLAADLGSFNNLPTERVMLDIQSALVGNFETMKKYGVVLNATTVQQKALNLGLAASKSELDAAAKAQAAYQLIVEGSTFAIGDMARTSDSFANQMKRLRAQVEDVLAAIGTGLLPAVTDIVSQMNNWIKANEDFLKQELPTVMRDVGSAVGSVAKVVADSVILFGDLGRAMELNRLMQQGVIDESVVLNTTMHDRVRILNELHERHRAGREDFDALNAATQDAIDRNRILVDIVREEANEYARLDDAIAAVFADIDKTDVGKQLAKNVFESIDEARRKMAEAQEEARRTAEAFRDVGVDISLQDFFSEIDEAEQKMTEAAEVAKNAKESLQLAGIDIALDDFYADIDAMEQALADSQNVMVDLTQNTAERMQDNFSNLFFDFMRGELKSLDDYASAVFDSISRVMADFLAQQATQSLFGAGGKSGGAGGLFSLIGSGISALFGGGAAKGAVFEPIAPKRFAAGDVFTRDTYFGYNEYGRRKTGVMGEAGAEGVLPLKRTKEGKLGVSAEGVSASRTVNITNNFNIATQDGRLPTETRRQLEYTVGRSIQRSLERNA